MLKILGAGVIRHIIVPALITLGALAVYFMAMLNGGTPS